MRAHTIIYLSSLSSACKTVPQDAQPCYSVAVIGGALSLAGYRRPRFQEYYQRAWIVRAKVEASAAIRSSLATAFRVSVFVPDVRWSAICWRSRWISPMLSFIAHLFRNLDRLFGSGSFRNGFLLWHHNRIWDHFRDVDR